MMDCLFCATHFLINPQPHPGGGESERGPEEERGRKERNKEKLPDKRKTKEVVNNTEKQMNEECSTRSAWSGWRVHG